MTNIKVSASILNADFDNIAPVCQQLIDSGVDMIHFDVMDGVFVPNSTFGVPFVASLNGKIDTVFDVHLMIENPELYVCQFIEAGADIVTFHAEACDNVLDTIQLIHSAGAKAGLAISPETPVDTVLPYLSQLDMVLVMTVNPGKGGQQMIVDALSKVSAIRAVSSIDIQVDGGITVGNVGMVVDAGANVIVSGSHILNSDNMANTISKLKLL